MYVSVGGGRHAANLHDSEMESIIVLQCMGTPSVSPRLWSTMKGVARTASCEKSRLCLRWAKMRFTRAKNRGSKAPFFVIPRLLCTQFCICTKSYDFLWTSYFTERCFSSRFWLTTWTQIALLQVNFGKQCRCTFIHYLYLWCWCLCLIYIYIYIYTYIHTSQILCDALSRRRADSLWRPKKKHSWPEISFSEHGWHFRGASRAFFSFFWIRPARREQSLCEPVRLCTCMYVYTYICLLHFCSNIYI